MGVTNRCNKVEVEVEMRDETTNVLTALTDHYFCYVNLISNKYKMCSSKTLSIVISPRTPTSNIVFITENNFAQYRKNIYSYSFYRIIKNNHLKLYVM